MKLHGVVGGALLAVVGFTASANAATVELGRLSLGGDVIVTATQLNWVGNQLNGGDFIIFADSTTGIFDHLDNTEGFAENLDSTVHLTDPGVFAEADFLSFQADPNLTFSLTGVAQCFACVFPGSPLNFVTNPFTDDTTVTLGLRGNVYDGLTFVGAWQGTWSADFVDETTAELIARFQLTGSLLAPYSAITVTTTEVDEVPEPITMGLLGVGLLGLAAARRRRQ